MFTVSLSPTDSWRFFEMVIVSFLSTVLGAIAVDRDRLVVVDGLGAIVLDVGRLVVIDRLRPIVADPVRLVVLDLDVLVLLGVDEELLRALLVLEPDLVEVGRRRRPCELRVFIPLCVLFAGRSYGGICSAL